MAVGESFLAFVRDQLRSLGPVTARAMFGGYGLYLDGTFFAIIHGDRLYFKTDPRTAADYIDQGMQPFRPNPRQTLKDYYEVPPDVLEDIERVQDWAKTALGVARRV